MSNSSLGSIAQERNVMQEKKLLEGALRAPCKMVAVAIEVARRQKIADTVHAVALLNKMLAEELETLSEMDDKEFEKVSAEVILPLAIGVETLSKQMEQDNGNVM